MVPPKRLRPGCRAALAGWKADLPPLRRAGPAGKYRPGSGPPGPGRAPSGGGERSEPGGKVWLFDLDDTLHDASTASMPGIHVAMGSYIRTHLGLTEDESNALRRRYWQRYGATLLGLIRHHGVNAHHFLHETHQLPGLEARVRGHRHDLAALKRLPGRKVLLTNAPAAYASRVLAVLGIGQVFERIVTIEDMHMFGQLRPKPDTRMLRHVAARLHVHPAQCVLVEDTLGHLKAARRLAMGTVWMWRFRRGSRSPASVDRRISALRQLLR